jgi:hypothetical protein
MIHRRAPASILAVALSAAVGLGCGAGDSTDGTSGASAEALARVSAADFARGVNLRASDVPYFESQPDEGEEDPRQRHRQEQELLRCIGVKESDDSLADVESPTYGTESPGELLNVASSVEVVLGAEEAARQLKLFRSRRSERCLRSVYVSAVEEEESSTTEVRNASVTRVRFPAPEIEDGFACRFTASVIVHAPTSQLSAYRPAAEPKAAQTLKVYVDILGFAVGPVEVTLTATGIPAPVSKNLERNLLGVLHARASERRP